MAPVLQRAIAVTVGILLGLFFLRQVTLVVGGNPSHVLQIIRIIFGGILLGILFQDFNNLSPAVEASASVKRMHFARSSDKVNHNWQQLLGAAKVAQPFMTNALSGAVVLGPTRLRGVVPPKPCFELVGSHVDCIVEISIRRQRHAFEPDST